MMMRFARCAPRTLASVAGCASPARTPLPVTVEELQSRIVALDAKARGDVRGRDGRAVDEAIEMLDEGELRVAEPT